MHHPPQVNKAYVLIVLNLQLATVEELLEDTGLTLEKLEAMNTVDLPVAIRVVRNMDRYSSNPNWPALFGAHLGIASHGPAGFAALSAPTVGKALATFAEYFKLRAETYNEKINLQAKHVEIIISDTTGDDVFEEFYFEAFIGWHTKQRPDYSW